MRFQVPQFIEVEDKIFGPLTLKQFIYLGGGLGFSIILYISPIPKFISIVFIIPMIVFSLALAFYKINNKPFIYIVEAAFKYMMAHKLYIWKKQERAVQKAISDEDKDAIEYAKVMVPKISDSKLKDLTWSLDIKDSIYSQEKPREGGPRNNMR